MGKWLHRWRRCQWNTDICHDSKSNSTWQVQSSVVKILWPDIWRMRHPSDKLLLFLHVVHIKVSNYNFYRSTNLVKFQGVKTYVWVWNCGKREEELPKKSVGWLLTNSQLTLSPQLTVVNCLMWNFSTNCWPTVSRQNTLLFFPLIVHFSCPGHPFITASADRFTQVKYVITIIVTLL